MVYIEDYKYQQWIATSYSIIIRIHSSFSLVAVHDIRNFIALRLRGKQSSRIYTDDVIQWRGYTSAKTFLGFSLRHSSHS